MVFERSLHRGAHSITPKYMQFAPLLSHFIDYSWFSKCFSLSLEPFRHQTSLLINSSIENGQTTPPCEFLVAQILIKFHFQNSRQRPQTKTYRKTCPEPNTHTYSTCDSVDNVIDSVILDTLSVHGSVFGTQLHERLSTSTVALARAR